MFYTDAGRPVYAAGGITPDDVIRYDKTSKFVQRLQAHGAFFNFAVDYLARHPDLGRDVEINDAIRKEFFQFTQAQGIESSSETMKDYGQDPSRDLIDSAIRTELLNSKFGLSEGWRSALRTDKQAQEAIHQFPEAERIAALPKKSPSQRAASQRTSLN